MYFLGRRKTDLPEVKASTISSLVSALMGKSYRIVSGSGFLIFVRIFRSFTFMVVAGMAVSAEELEKATALAWAPVQVWDWELVMALVTALALVECIRLT
jgi:hypothetical protein